MIFLQADWQDFLPWQLEFLKVLELLRQSRQKVGPDHDVAGEAFNIAIFSKNKEISQPLSLQETGKQRKMRALLNRAIASGDNKARRKYAKELRVAEGREKRRIRRLNAALEHREKVLKKKKKRSMRHEPHKRLKLKNKSFSLVPQSSMGPRFLGLDTASLLVAFQLGP